jgi:amino acid transporter
MKHRKQYNYNKIFSIIALIFGVAGTIIIWFDSQNSIQAISSLLKETSITVGYWQDQPIEKEKMEMFENTLNKASKLDIRGFILLMFSFILQLVSHFEFGRNVKGK